MIQAFKKWCVEEWRKQTPFDKRMMISTAPAMLGTVVMTAAIAVGAPLPILPFAAALGVVQAIWSAGIIGFLVWQRWRKARVDYQTKLEWREEAETSRLKSHFG
jgi:hypothetical protein